MKAEELDAKLSFVMDFLLSLLEKSGKAEIW